MFYTRNGNGKVRLKRGNERTTKITNKKLFWYNNYTIPRVKTIIDIKSKLYEPPKLIKENHLKNIEKCPPKGPVSGIKNLDSMLDKRLKPLRNVSCPKLVTDIINKKVEVDEKGELVLDIQPRIQKFIKKLEKKLKDNKNYDYIISKNDTFGRDKRKLLDVLALSDKLNPSRDQRYSNPNRFRSLGASRRPAKTADPHKDKRNEGPAEVPIADMIMQNIDRLNIVPGLWNKLLAQHSLINEEITQTHENETQGPDLSIANLKREKDRMRFHSLASESSPISKKKAYSRKSSRSSLMSRDKLSKKIQRGKCHFASTQRFYEEQKSNMRLFKGNSELANINFQMNSLRSKREDPEVIKVMERINENIKNVLAPPSKRKIIKKKKSITDYSFSSGDLS
ncbi:unnamed protein product [Moneuplotes crassus]|uniref:Uncharacterized protein n=2 Tax=Euplotes crassus TaxID=5936 RepID=A0AAD1UKQ8_EUPCR|nr:unnamed protein product [Moneuplotes crassus]